MKRIPLAIVASTLLAVSACSSSGGGDTTPTGSAGGSTGGSSEGSSTPAGTTAGGGTGGAGGATITIKNFAYSGDLSVAPGTKITVIDDDSAAHTLTDKDGKFDSGNVAGDGGKVTLTAPSTAGSYALICKYHPQMSGTLTVK